MVLGLPAGDEIKKYQSIGYLHCTACVADLSFYRLFIVISTYLAVMQCDVIGYEFYFYCAITRFIFYMFCC